MAAGSKIKRIYATRIYEKRVEAWRRSAPAYVLASIFSSWGKKTWEPQHFKGNLLNIIIYLWEFLPQTALFCYKQLVLLDKTGDQCSTMFAGLVFYRCFKCRLEFYPEKKEKASILATHQTCNINPSSSVRSLHIGNWANFIRTYPDHMVVINLREYSGIHIPKLHEN